MRSDLTSHAEHGQVDAEVLTQLVDGRARLANQEGEGVGAHVHQHGAAIVVTIQGLRGREVGRDMTPVSLGIV